MILQTWCAKWGIPAAALADLAHQLTHSIELSPRSGDAESVVQNNYRIAFSERERGILWRNNLGAAKDANGNFFRYGLANDTPQANKKVKSGDLIGIRPVLITPEMVGNTVGQFVSREVKKVGWRWTGTEREQAQLAWAMLVISLGGDAGIVEGKKQ